MQIFRAVFDVAVPKRGKWRFPSGGLMSEVAKWMQDFVIM